MDKTLNAFLFIISFNFLMRLLGWPEFLLINSLSLLCPQVAALPWHSGQRRTIFFFLIPFSYPILGAWFGTVLIICAPISRVILHEYPSTIWLSYLLIPLPPWHNPPFCPLTTLRSVHFFTPRLESETEHIYPCVYGYGTSPSLLVGWFFICVCVFCIHLQTSITVQEALSSLLPILHASHSPSGILFCLVSL